MRAESNTSYRYQFNGAVRRNRSGTCMSCRAVEQVTERERFEHVHGMCVPQRCDNLHSQQAKTGKLALGKRLELANPRCDGDGIASSLTRLARIEYCTLFLSPTFTCSSSRSRVLSACNHPLKRCLFRKSMTELVLIGRLLERSALLRTEEA